MLVVNPEEDSSIKFIRSLKERLALPTHSMGKSTQSMGDLQKAAGGSAPKDMGVSLMGVRLDVDLPFELRALEICLDEVGVGRFPDARLPDQWVNQRNVS